jgi:hypothetical protein
MIRQPIVGCAVWSVGWPGHCKSGLIQGLHIAVTISNWVRHGVSHFTAYLPDMKINTYRWQDYSISPQRTLVELIATVLVVVALTIAVVPYDDQARDAHWQAAGPSSLHTEEASQLAAIARQRVLPRGACGP